MAAKSSRSKSSRRVSRSYRADEDRINKDTGVRDEWRKRLDALLGEEEQCVAFERGTRSGADKEIGEYSIPDNTAVIRKSGDGIRVHAFELKALRWKQKDKSRLLTDALLGDVTLLEIVEYATASDLFTIVLEVPPQIPASMQRQIDSLKDLLTGKGIGLWLLSMTNRDTCAKPQITVIQAALDRSKKTGAGVAIAPDEERRREILFKNVSPPWITEALNAHSKKSMAAAAQGNLRRFILANYGEPRKFTWESCSPEDAKSLAATWKEDGKKFVERSLRDPKNATEENRKTKFSHVKRALDSLCKHLGG